MFFNDQSLLLLFNRYFIDLEILDLDMLSHVPRQHLNYCFLIGPQSHISLLVCHLLASQKNILAFREISHKMMSVTCHIVELNKSGFFLIVGVHLQVVLVQNDIVGSIVSEDVRVHILQQCIVAFVKNNGTSSQLVDLDVSFRSVDNQVTLINNPVIYPIHLQLDKIFSSQPLHHIS